ncbi:MAG: histidine phosphatase family protein [Chloroflexia bacterium]
MRHAIAYDRDAARWPDDDQRPLTREGEDRFRRAARGLALVAPRVERVLSSPAVRAWRTAEILCEVVGWPPPTPLDELAEPYSGAGPLEALEPHAEVRSLALVGHEPYLSQLAAHLLTGAEEAPSLFEMKKGSCAYLGFGQAEAGEGVLHWLLPPKVLRALHD